MVVQFIIRAEAFALGTGADAARDIELAPGHVFPNARKGMEISRVSGLCGHVGYTGIQVTGPYGMAYDFILFEDGLVVLAVCAGSVPVGAPSRFFHEIPGCTEIFFFSGDFVEFGQCHFHDRMSRRHMFLSFIRAEYTAYQICVFDSHVQQGTFARGAIVCHGSFVKMS